ncbi:MAG: beta strand repeat-containing protein [Selenomonas sp.]
MAYKIDLSAVNTDGTFTVGKTDGDGTLASLKATDSVTSSMKTVGNVSYSEDGTSTFYADSSAVSISGATGAWYISGSAKDDTIDGSGLSEGSTIEAGDGADSVVGATGITINTGAGNDTISVAAQDTVDAGEGADSIVIAGTEAVVTAGAGNDTISVGAAATSATIDAGEGADSIVVGGKDATITLGSGKDTVSIGSTGATLTDYTFGEDTIVMSGVSYTNLTSDGKISVSGADVALNTTNGYYAADVASVSGGTAVHYAWAGDSAATIDGSSQKEALVIVGTTNDEGDLLIGGSGADSIYAGSGDSVVAGKGNDTISIANKATDVVIGVYNQSGADSVVGFEGGFEDDDDTIYVDSTATKFKIDTISGGLAFKAKGSTVSVAGSSLTTTANTTAAEVKINYGGTAYNAEVINGGAALDEDATYIYGVAKGTTVSLTGSDDYNIDLSGNKGYGDTRTYYQIAKVDASKGEGDYVLVGDGSTANTLIGGTSTTSLYGGGSSKDSLVGGSGADTFFYGSGDGKDTISSYTAEDVINFYSGSITKVKATTTGATITLDNSTANKLTIAGTISATKALTVNYTTDGTNVTTAAIGLSTTSNTFTYDEDVKQYIGSTKGDTLKVTGDDDANIWLDGSTGVSYSNVKLVDASSSKGDVVLAGSTANETIKGSKGSASLFGGFGTSNDVLVGGGSQADTTFYFGKGCGKDTITSSNSTDRVMLYDVALSDLKSAELNSSGAMVVTLNDGSSLTVQHASSGVNTYQLTDGTWTYNTSTKSWAQA